MMYLSYSSRVYLSCKERKIKLEKMYTRTKTDCLPTRGNVAILKGEVLGKQYGMKAGKLRKGRLLLAILMRMYKCSL